MTVELLRPERTRSAYLAAHPPRRAPFPHESHVDFGAMDRVFNRARSEAVRVFKRHRSRLIVALVDAVAAVLLLGDRGGLGSLPTTRTSFDRDLARILERTAEEAAFDVIREARRQGVVIQPQLSTELARQLRDQAEAVEALLRSDLASAAGRSALRNAGPATAPRDVARVVKRELGQLSDRYLQDQLGGSVTVAQNLGRAEIMKTEPPKVVYASELLDSRTCKPCEDIDGREFASLAEALRFYPTGGFRSCLGRERCRGTLVSLFV